MVDTGTPELVQYFCYVIELNDLWYDISAFTRRTASIRRMSKREFPSARPVSGPRLGWTAAPPTHGHVFAARTSDLSLLAPAFTDPRWGHETNPGPACHACNKTLRPSQAFLTCSNSNCDTASHKQECCSGIKRALYRLIRGYALIAEVLSRSAVPIAVLPRMLLSSLVKSSVRRQPLIYKASRNAPAWYVTARPGLRYVRSSAQDACANATRAARVSQERNRKCTSWLVPGDARTAR